MIHEKSAKKFCKDDISKIENYDKAITDTTQTWVCHHRLGLTLDGEHAHSREELKRLDMYFHRPYFELIFLTESEHRSLHNTSRKHSDATKRKISEALIGEKHPMYGKPGTMKGKPVSEETRRKRSESMKGKTHSAAAKKKMSDARKAYWVKRKEQT